MSNAVRTAVASPLEPTQTVHALTRPPSGSSRLASSILWGTCITASLWLLAYIVLRAAEPYPLDAFEEYELHKLIRWQQGSSLYGAPAEEVLPEAYPPCYFWLLALSVRMVGESFAAARCLSLLAMLGVVAAGCWALSEAPVRVVARLSFLTVLLGFHALSGKWFEVGKPDSVLLFWIALALVTGRHRSWTEVAISSVALLVGSLTKQNAPLILLPLCFSHVLNGRWRWAMGWGAAMSLVIAGCYCLLDWYWSGNFFYWVFSWTAGHSIDVWGGIARTVRSLVTRGPMLIVILVASVACRPRCHWTWCLVTALGLAVMGMSKQGGLENHLLPAAFVGAVVAGRWAGENWYGKSVQWGGCSWRWAVAACLVMVVWPGFPTGRDFRWLRKRAEEIDDWVAAVRKLEGRVAVSHHLVLARRAGADCFFSDLILEFPGLKVPASVREQIGGQEFDYIVFETNPDRSPTPGWSELIADNYVARGELDFPSRSGVLPNRVFMSRRHSVRFATSDEICSR